VVNPAGSSPDSLDLVLEEVKAVKVAAAAQIASLDAKAGFVLGSASCLAAAASAPPTPHCSRCPYWWAVRATRWSSAR